MTKRKHVPMELSEDQDLLTISSCIHKSISLILFSLKNDHHTAMATVYLNVSSEGTAMRLFESTSCPAIKEGGWDGDPRQSLSSDWEWD